MLSVWLRQNKKYLWLVLFSPHDCCSMGLDLVKGTVRNNLEAGVIEPAMSKVKIIQVRVELDSWINLWRQLC